MSMMKKIRTGVPGFDVLTAGGLPSGRSALVVGRSGTGNIGLDQIGKGLGEFLRSCTADIPIQLLEDAKQPAEQVVA